jgi:hypothetical protein
MDVHLSVGLRLATDSILDAMRERDMKIVWASSKGFPILHEHLAENYRKIHNSTTRRTRCKQVQ